MKILLKMIKGLFISNPKEGQVLTYNSSTGNWENRDNPGAQYKTWMGRATVGSSGTWSINFAEAGFTTPPKVFVQSYGVSDVGGRTFACVGSVTTTGANGYCNTSTTAGVLLITANTQASNGTVIDVLAIGT